MVARGWCKSVLKYSAERGVGVCLGEKIFGERFN
jgi:hypothetical protein